MKGGDYWRETVDVFAADDDVRKPPALAAREQVVDEFRWRAHQRERRLGHHLGFNAHSLGEALDRTLRIFGDIDHERTDIHLDVIKAIADRVAHDVDLAVHSFGGHRRDRLGPNSARSHRGVNTDDVGVLRGVREHALTAAADQDWRARRLNRFGRAVVICDRVVLARI